MNEQKKERCILYKIVLLVTVHAQMQLPNHNKSMTAIMHKSFINVIVSNPKCPERSAGAGAAKC